MSTRAFDNPKVVSLREEWVIARTAEAARDDYVRIGRK
jgi:hypothetical protein